MSIRVTNQAIDVLGAGSGQLRVTSQSIDVLGPGDGKLHVSRQYVEALRAVAVNMQGAYNVLSLAHSAAVEQVLGAPTVSGVAVTTVAASGSAEVTKIHVNLASANAAFSLSQNPTVVYVAAPRSAGNALNVTDTVAVNYSLARPVSHTLGIAGTASRALTKKTQSSSDVNIVDVATVQKTHAYTCAANSTIDLFDFAEVHRCRLGVSTLELTDAAVVEVVRMAASSVAITQAATVEGVFNRRRIDGLSITHSADVVHVVKEASHTIVLTTSADAYVSFAAESALALTHSADVTTNRVAAHNDLLTLTHRSTVGFIKSVTAGNAILLKQSARPGAILVSAESTLQYAHHNVDPVTGADTLSYIGLNNSASASISHTQAFLAASNLLLEQLAAGVVIKSAAIDCQAENTLTLADSADRNYAPAAASQIVLLQTATVSVCRVATDTLKITQVASQSIFRAVLTATSTIDIEQAVAYVVPHDAYKHLYHPFGNVLPSACPTPIPGIGPCRFVYPASHPTENLLLRSPEFGDIDRLTFNRISRETRGGTLLVFADPMWPKVETKLLTIKGLTADQAHDYLAFAENHLGLEVGFVDWEGFYWKGIITNPTEPAVQDTRDTFTIALEFECQPAAWEP